MIPHGGDTALMFAARHGDLVSAKLLVDGGANVNDQDAWGVSATTLAAFSGYGEIARYLLEKGADPNADSRLHRAPLRHHAARRNDGGSPARARRRIRTHRRVWTPTRRSSDDYHFMPALVDATPYWLAARFTQPDVMRLLAKHGADTKVIHESNYVQGEGYQRRKERTTAIMAALGMGGGTAWVPIDRAERDALILETVKVAVELGADVNVASTDGRTALDSARAQKYEAVASFLAGSRRRRVGALTWSPATSFPLRQTLHRPIHGHPRAIDGIEFEMLRDFRRRPLRFDACDDELALSRLESVHRRAVARVRLLVNRLLFRRRRVRR